MNLSIRRFGIALFAISMGLFGAQARAQLPTSEEKLKILTDPESVKKKLDKDKVRDPLEVFRTSIAPFDALPFVKANHWSTFSLEARANYDDYYGWWQSAPVRLLGMPQDIIYKRDARLLKTQRSRISMQLMLPEIPKDLFLELTRPESIRPDQPWSTTLRPLLPHQMLVLVLTKETSDGYSTWNRFQAMYPYGLDRNDAMALDKSRYYRLVLPLEPDKPLVSAHPLTWTSISHIVWDGMPPDNLNPFQQEAMLDWLHWGGQLTIMAGGPSVSILKDSFLAPYLPAETTSENKLLTQDDLKPLSQSYPPPIVSLNPDNPDDGRVEMPEPAQRDGRIYRSAVPIKPAPNRPVYLAGLKPNPGAIGIPLAESGEQLVAVEKRVGRGRILMLAINLTDPAIASWPGVDTFVKRVVLRRPEEPLAARIPWDGQNYGTSRFGALPGPDLSWVRYMSRDMGGIVPPPKIESPISKSSTLGNFPTASGSTPPDPADTNMVQLSTAAVAEWTDFSGLPRMCRDALKESSGIKIPNASFVLKVILAYLIALVPLNWLICRYVFNRREMAWVVVPLISLAFGIGVERAAAFDIGYNSSCDEIDLIETHSGYPRAHVSRFASLYSTGRTRFTVSYPNDRTALALPLNSGLSLRGEDITGATWSSSPEAALEGYLVQPRSQSLYRAEQMLTLDGTVTLESDDKGRRIVNGTSLELRDAVLVDAGPKKTRKELFIGTIGPGATVEVTEASRPGPTADDAEALALGRDDFLKAFREEYEDRPENAGEIRLVAWTRKAVSGQKIEPAVDRHRGFTAVVVHLRQGDPPSPNGPVYNEVEKKSDNSAENLPGSPTPSGFSSSSRMSSMVVPGGRVPGNNRRGR